MVFPEITIPVRFLALINKPQRPLEGSLIRMMYNIIQNMISDFPIAQKMLPTPNGTGGTPNILKLRTKMEELYSQVGIVFDYRPAQITDPVLTYDPASEEYREFFNSSGNLIPESAFGFVNRIYDRHETGFKNFRGISIVITDFDCKSEMVNGSQLNIQGVAVINTNACFIIKNSHKEYGIYAHEVGHTLNCIHTFHDGSIVTQLDKYLEKRERMDRIIEESRIAIKESKLEAIRNNESFWVETDDENLTLNDWDIFLEGTGQREAYDREESNGVLNEENYLEQYYDWKLEQGISDNMNREDIERHNGYIEFAKDWGFEPFLYDKDSTKNVLDYNLEHKYFFKWQWKIIRESIRRF